MKSSLKSGKGKMSKIGILKKVPYGSEFLFLDEVISLDDSLIIANKKIDGSEPYMKGHFKTFPIMPGALTIEAIGQAASLMIRHKRSYPQDVHVLAYSVMNAKFYAPILPGQEMVIEVRKKEELKNKVLVEGSVKVNGRIVASAAIIIAIVNKGEFEGKAK